MDSLPWIAGRNELVRLVAARHDDDAGVIGELGEMAALGGVNVFDGRESNTPSWGELLDASFRALETVGREIAAAQTADEVAAADLRREAYERQLAESISALLRVAHKALTRRPMDGGWLVGYGRKRTGGALELIAPTAWEAGQPDWEQWRLEIYGKTAFHGIRLLMLDDVDAETMKAIVDDLDGKADNRRARAPGRFSPREVEEWYRQRVENWPPDSPPPSREDDEAAAREALGTGVTREAVRRARRLLAPQSWRTQGRRPGL